MIFYVDWNNLCVMKKSDFYIKGFMSFSDIKSKFLSTDGHHFFVLRTEITVKSEVKRSAASNLTVSTWREVIFC